ncbi:MAG: diphthine--ammonia ligase [Defluviitaleaceae bacterium]|nr:diphthine--ammonia ligase [Defluviitaleaceae bacterium]
MKFVASYSGGKESALAVYRAIQEGHEPLALITTYNTDANRSHFHGLTEEILERVSHSLSIPLWLIKTSGADYVLNFEKTLHRAKEQGAEACVFGDIDIEGHIEWCSERCKNVGITPLFPLLNQSRKDVVYQLIDSGFIANITIVNTKKASDKFLGKQLTKEIAEEIAAGGADICGENGEYHTFVSAGPCFKQPVKFSLGAKVLKDDYAVLPVLSD